MSCFRLNRRKQGALFLAWTSLLEYHDLGEVATLRDDLESLMGDKLTDSPAHLAVEFEDLPQLRDLLDAGHDVEDEEGCHDGWTLLRHAIDVEWDGHAQTGEPLQVNVTAYLLARGADPLRIIKGRSVLSEAERIGHWLAVDIMNAWIARGGRA